MSTMPLISWMLVKATLVRGRSGYFWRRSILRRCCRIWRSSKGDRPFNSRLQRVAAALQLDFTGFFPGLSEPLSAPALWLGPWSTQVYPCTYLLPVVKVQLLGWLPETAGSWSSLLPATSMAPVVTTALYLVLAAKSFESSDG